MRFPWRLLVGLAVAVAVPTAIYLVFRDPPSASYPTVTALIDDLQAKGVECMDPSATENDTPGVDAVGSCSNPGKELFIWVFDDPERAHNEIGWDFKPLRTNRPPSREIFVVGANWIVKTMSPEGSEEVQEALGGSIHT